MKAGTATASTAPLKFTSGTNLTTAEAGAMEYNNNWYLTNNSLLRYGLGGVIDDFNTDAGNTSTTETDLYSTTLVANTLGVDKDKIIAEYSGIVITSGGTATRQLRVYFGGTVIFNISFNYKGVFNSCEI